MTSKKRTRMSPQARRMQILDSARDIIQRQGLSSFTMEALAIEANISNPLVYKYFETRLALLRELLEREYDRYVSTIRKQVAGASTFEEIVSIFVHLNFEEASQGSIVYILRAQPDVRAVIHDSEQEAARSVGKQLKQAVRARYHLKPSEAEQLVVLGSGASQAAAMHYARFGGNRNAFIERAIAFITGGIDSLKR